MGYTCLSEKEVLGWGRNAVSFAQVPVARATEYAGEETDIGLRLWMILKPRLAAESVTTVYETLERPLAPVLALMERAGVMVERAMLSRLSLAFAQTCRGSRRRSRAGRRGFQYRLAQAARRDPVRQDGTARRAADQDRRLEHRRRRARRTRSQGHELPRKVLDWRLLAKLKSTYTDALPAYIHPETGRVHTTYALAATIDGPALLQRSEPPEHPDADEEGRAIRKAFVAEKGKKLISADYSQIELRVLAHMADTPTLAPSFRRRARHSRHDGVGDVRRADRRHGPRHPPQGQGHQFRHHLRHLRVRARRAARHRRSEAGAYIRTYFKRFPGIRDYMEAMKAEPPHGYVKTLFGRKVHYPEINTKNPSLRGNYERAAINAPIQGSAADIIRRAMIRMGPALAAAGLSARMLMQVHDELVFEAPEDEVDKTMEVAQAVMEKAPEPVLRLSVPLKVDARSGDNWEAAH